MNVQFIFLVLGLLISITWLATNPYPLIQFVMGFTKHRISTGIFLIVTVVWIQSFFRIIYHSEVPQSSVLRITGILIGTLGVFLAVWAKLTMKKSWGMAGQHNPQKQTELITYSPFSFSRNPIYVGLLMYLFGFELAIQSPLILLVLPAFGLVHRSVLKEEKLLKEFFKDKYLKYKAQVPRYFYRI